MRNAGGPAAPAVSNDRRPTAAAAARSVVVPEPADVDEVAAVEGGAGGPVWLDGLPTAPVLVPPRVLVMSRSLVRERWSPIACVDECLGLPAAGGDDDDWTRFAAGCRDLGREDERTTRC